MTLAACSAQLPDGYDEFKTARSEYESLDSAKVTMTDLGSGEQVMEFSFYLSAKDEMVFSYTGTWDGVTQQAYSDGITFYYKESADGEWNVIGSGDDNYIYNVYNREYRYPYAEGRIFFLAAEAVDEAAVTEQSDGGTLIEYTYDPAKLNEASMPGVEEEISEFSSLETSLLISPDGIPVQFVESGSVTTVSGENLTLNMQIDVTDINAVTEIPNPVGS